MLTYHLKNIASTSITLCILNHSGSMLVRENGYFKIFCSVTQLVINAYKTIKRKFKVIFDCYVLVVKLPTASSQ